MGVQIGRHGIWARSALLSEGVAQRVEDLGFGTLWVGGSPSGDLAAVEAMLDATSRITVATSVVNMWTTPAAQVAASYLRIAERHPDRLLLGVGVGHREATAEYRSPYETIVAYLDRLDEAGVPVRGRLLAALGPKVVALAGRRSAGPLPYLTTPQHTARARALVGDGPLVVPEQKVVLTEALGLDSDAAHSLARAAVSRPYLQLSNYRRSLAALGFTEDELDTPADRLIDALAPQGTASRVADALDAHLAAGANHVAAQVVAPDAAGFDASLVALSAALGLR